MKTPRWLLVLGAVGAVLFGVFIWPTAYRWDRFTAGGGQSYPMKVNRFTGASYFFTPGAGWEMVTGGDAIGKVKNLPVEEVKKIRADATIKGGYPYDGKALQLSIYNGSAWKVKQVLVEISLIKSDFEVLLDAPPTNQVVFPVGASRFYHFKSKKTGRDYWAEFNVTPSNEVLGELLSMFDDSKDDYGGLNKVMLARGVLGTFRPARASHQEGFPRVYAVSLFKGGDPLAAGEGSADLDFKLEGQKWSFRVVGAKGFGP